LLGSTRNRVAKRVYRFRGSCLYKQTGRPTVSWSPPPFRQYTHPPRRSGRSPALPYPPGRRTDFITHRSLHVDGNQDCRAVESLSCKGIRGEHVFCSPRYEGEYQGSRCPNGSLSRGPRSTICPLGQPEIGLGDRVSDRTVVGQCGCQTNQRQP